MWWKMKCYERSAEKWNAMKEGLKNEMLWKKGWKMKCYERRAEKWTNGVEYPFIEWILFSCNITILVYNLNVSCLPSNFFFSFYYNLFALSLSLSLSLSLYIYIYIYIYILVSENLRSLKKNLL